MFCWSEPVNAAKTSQTCREKQLLHTAGAPCPSWGPWNYPNLPLMPPLISCECFIESVIYYTLLISLHWLPVAARIQFKTLMLAYRTTTGSAPSYFHSLLRIYIPSRSLRSASERRLVVPSQRGSKSLSRTFSFTIPGWWNNLPTPIRNAGSLSIFKQQLKTHLFRHYLTSS